MLFYPPTGAQHDVGCLKRIRMLTSLFEPRRKVKGRGERGTHENGIGLNFQDGGNRRMSRAGEKLKGRRRRAAQKWAGKGGGRTWSRTVEGGGTKFGKHNIAGKAQSWRQDANSRRASSAGSSKGKARNLWSMGWGLERTRKDWQARRRCEHWETFRKGMREEHPKERTNGEQG